MNCWFDENAPSHNVNVSSDDHNHTMEKNDQVSPHASPPRFTPRPLFPLSSVTQHCNNTSSSHDQQPLAELILYGGDKAQDGKIMETFNKLNFGEGWNQVLATQGHGSPTTPPTTANVTTVSETDRISPLDGHLNLLAQASYSITKTADQQRIFKGLSVQSEELFSGQLPDTMDLVASISKQGRLDTSVIDQTPPELNNNGATVKSSAESPPDRAVVSATEADLNANHQRVRRKRLRSSVETRDQLSHVTNCLLPTKPNSYTGKLRPRLA